MAWVKKVSHPQAVPGAAVWVHGEHYDDWTDLAARFEEEMTDCFVELTQHPYPMRPRRQGCWLHTSVKDYSQHVGRDDAWLWKVLGKPLLVLYKESPDGPTIVYIRSR
jgi:hypothetical protein